MDDRRRRQEAEKRKKQAKKNLEKATEESKQVTRQAGREEEWANKHLDRMRMCFAEGTKLYYDIYKTLAMLTTGSILVIVALSRGVLPSQEGYPPLLWLAFFALLVAMLAALISMELITSGVFVTLTREAEEIERFSESTNNRLKWRTRISGWSFAFGIYLFLVFVILPPLNSLVGWWAYPLLVIPPTLVYVLLRKWL